MRIAILVLSFMPFVLAQRDSTSTSVDWKAMIPAIREVLKAESRRALESVKIEEHYSIAISETADITGDGVREALVYLGYGGASTDAMTVMRIENSKPVLAVFKGRDGRVSDKGFLRGASVMHTDGVELLPQERAVYSIHYNYGGGGNLHQCGGEAYKWNSHTKTFDYDAALTKKLTKRSCSQVPKTAG